MIVAMIWIFYLMVLMLVVMKSISCKTRTEHFLEAKPLKDRIVKLVRKHKESISVYIRGLLWRSIFTAFAIAYGIK